MNESGGLLVEIEATSRASGAEEEAPRQRGCLGRPPRPALSAESRLCRPCPADWSPEPPLQVARPWLPASLGGVWVCHLG